MLRRVSRWSGAGYVTGIVGVAVVTAIATPLHESLAHTTVALGYLLVVLLVATEWGRWPATAASVTGMLCFNFFFLPPLYTFTVADPQNWVALTAFLVTALAAGQLSQVATRRAAETEAIRTSARLATIRHRSLLEASLDALVTIGTDGRIDDVTSAIEMMTGRTRQMLIGTDFSECFSEPEHARALYRDVLRDGFVRDRPLAIRHQDGRVTSVLYNASLHRDDRGTVIGVVAAARPISTSAATAVMPMFDPELQRVLDRFVAAASVSSIVVGMLGLIGWTLDISVLKSVIPGQVIIKPNAALALVLCGASLWLLRTTRSQGSPALDGARAKEGGVDVQRPEAMRRRAGQLFAALVAVVGLLSLSEHLFGWDLGIDQLFFVDSNPWEAFGSVRPGLVAPITALDFLLIGLALLCLDWTITYRSHRFGPAQVLAFAANTGAMFGLLDVLLESHTSYTHIALQTAVILCVLSFAVACARTDWGLGALLVSSSYGGMLTRRLWPAAMVVPLLIGGMSWKAYSAGWFSEWGGITVMIVAMVTLAAVSTVLSALRIDRSDARRRQVEASLHRSAEELREAQRLARIGSWWWDPAADIVTWSEELYRIAGLDPKMAPPGLSEHARFYTADSFARLTAAIETAVHTGASFGLELDLVRGDGVIRSVTSRGEAERDAGGRVALVRGTVHDVTERKQAEEALRESEASLNKAQAIAHIGSWRLDVLRNQLIWSDEVFRIFGITRGLPLTYESFLASIHPADKNAVEAAWSAAMHGAPYDIEHRIIVDGTLKWVRERAEVEFDADGRAVKGVGTVQDITERKRAQEELLRVNRALRALSFCNQALIRATEESEWLHQVCRIIVYDAGYRFCWVGRPRHTEAGVTAAAQAGSDEGYLKANVAWTESEADGPTATCIRTRQIQIVNDTATDPAFALWRNEALKRGYASLVAIPLVVDSDLFGTITIYAAETGAFDHEEVALLTELASDLAFGIANLRSRAAKAKAEAELRMLNAELEARVRARTADLEAAHDREATIGFRIQQMLLLTRPPSDVPGLQIAALTIPSQQIDGDFYDFFRHENDCLDVIVADVMGKGIPAALLAGATKSNVLEALCHLMAMSRDGMLPEPKEIITLAHADMVRQLIDLESFVTLAYARLDLKRRVIDLVDCGHTGIMVVRGRTGACEMVHGDSLPLGIREGEIFDQIAIPFDAGDVFLFYSDGITDMRNRDGEFFGVDRLAECVRMNRDLAPDALVDAVRRTAVAFAQCEHPTDDLTCVVVKAVEVLQPLARAELDIPSDLNELGHVRAFVRDFCRAIPGGVLDEDDVMALELAANEAASNIIKHAYHGRTDQWIQLEADAFPDRLSIRLHHLGDSFDPRSVPPPALDGSRESGFGLYLITKCVDDVRHCRDERGRNCIDLVKALKADRGKALPCN